MRFGILCAGDSEAAPFLSMLEGDSTVEKAMLTFHSGKIGSADATVLFSGVCKVNAAIAAQLLIAEFHCGAVISAGTAGGLSERVRPLDIVVSTETAYHDVAPDILTEFHPWLPSVYFQADPRLLRAAEQASACEPFQGITHFGRTVTGESFITDQNRGAVKKAFEPLSVDMESAAAAHVCHAFRVPFIAVRAITDMADRRSPESFEENCEKATRLSASFVARMLEALGGL